MSCASVQSKSSASRRALFAKLCANKKDQSLLETSCRAFLAKPTHNPVTGKPIVPNKDLHNFYTELCGGPASQPHAQANLKPAKSAVAVTNAQIALEEMIELKIETYLTALDAYYTQRWGKGSKTTAASPVEWFTQVRNVESYVSLQYDQWVASGNEPVREFVTQHMQPSSLPESPAAYKTDLYDAAQAFFSHHDLLKLEDLDALLKAVKDKHLAALSTFSSVHAERKQRQLFLTHVDDLQARFLQIFKSDRDAKDTTWIRTEYGGLVQAQRDPRLAKFAEQVYNNVLEVSIQRSAAIALSDLEKAFYAARRKLFV